MPYADRIRYAGLGHLHILVDNIDEAADFYREVLDFIEMQSHDRLINKGAATYYGYGDDYENLEISLRFLFIPEVLTIKLVRITFVGDATRYGRTPIEMTTHYPHAFKSDNVRYHQIRGMGPVNLYVEDLDETFESLVKYARDYSSRFKFQIVSPPTYLSPILPHQIGARKESVLHGQNEILQDLAATFPKRAKFHLIDPYGVTWEFNNNLI